MKTLKIVEEKELRLILLQLVQALRYEPLKEEGLEEGGLA